MLQFKLVVIAPPAHLDFHFFWEVLQKLFSPVKPGNDHHLQEGEEEKVPGGGRRVEQGEHVDAGGAGEGEPKQESDWKKITDVVFLNIFVGGTWGCEKI